MPDVFFISDGLQPAALAEGQTAGEGEDNWKLGPLQEGAASYLPSLFPAGYIPSKILLYCLEQTD